MENNIWKILGIPPTNDTTAIKRAYSSLARKCNPEDDPDGFRVLHDAYRAALSFAKSGARVIVVQPPEVKRPVPTEKKDPAEEPSGKDEQYEWSDVSPSSNKEKKEEPVKKEGQYEWPEYTPVSKDVKKEEPEEKKDRYEWSDVSPAPKEEKKKEPAKDEDQYEWPEHTPASKDVKKKEPEEKKDRYEWSDVSPAPKEKKTEPAEKEDQYEWPENDDEPQEPLEEEVKEPEFDFSPVAEEPVKRDPRNNGYVADLRELIGVFKEINRIKTYKGLAELGKEDKRRLAKELFNRYIQLADASRDTEVWKEFWEEPLIHYFECDPDFRKFILDTLEKKPQTSRERYRIEHYEAVKKLTDNMADLPVQHRWTDKQTSWLVKPQKDLTGDEKKKAAIVSFVFPVAVIIILAIIIYLIERFG